MTSTTLPATLYARLRDRDCWQGRLTGLTVDQRGALVLERLPAPGWGGIKLEPPFEPAPSGIAVTACGDVVLADGDAHRLVVATTCGDRAVLGGPGTLPGQFDGPASLALAQDRLFVADAGNSRVLVFRLPALSLADIWQKSFVRPIGVAADGSDRVLVLDQGARTLRRFAVEGTEDLDFGAATAAAFAANGGLADPVFLAAGAMGWAVLSDAGRREVLLVDAAGHWLGPLEPPNPVWHPRALATYRGWLYVADAATGTIHAMDGPSGAWLGALPGWLGSVAAMATTLAGDLLVKTGPAPDHHELQAGAGCVAMGRLEAGPFDAGLENGWEVLWIDMAEIAGGRVRAWIAARGDPLPAPVEGDWSEAPVPASLVELVSGPGQARESRRQLWLRLELVSADRRTSPSVLQAQLSTPGEALIDYLPSSYARSDGSLADDPASGSPRAFLRRFLGLLGHHLHRMEEVLDGFPQRLHPTYAAGEDLPWLAEWLALELPRRLDEAARRRLLARAIQLHGRRGTSASLREFVQLQSGVASRIEESWRQRGIWILDHSSRLGFDTMLPLVDPQGLVVEGPRPSDGRCPELAGSATVGEAVILAETDLFEALFTDWAHHFRIFVGPEAAAAPTVSAVQAVLDAEKPSHTDYSLCAAAPGVRVGWQARVGIDAIVAGPAPVGALDMARLGHGSVLGAGEAPRPDAPRLGMQTILGRDMNLG